MKMRTRGDVGETLIEVLFTIVIVGLTFSGLFLSLGTAGNAGNVQRASVQADVVLRNYAEATKAAAQTCVANGKYTVTYPPPLPPGFTLSVTGTGAAAVGLPSACPDVTTPQTLKLQVTGPLSFKATMDIRVRTP
jgi:type II secretory pathway pseudopilin PulG